MIIGTIQASSWLLLSLIGWPLESLPFIALAIGAFMTGGIHLDGLVDTADGIAAGSKKAIQAMKDSRAGAIGVLSLIIILGVQFSSLIKINNYAPLALPISLFIGRCAPIWAIGKFPYIQEEGRSNFHKQNWAGFTEEIKPSLIIGLIIISSLLLSPISSKIILITLASCLISIIPIFWFGEIIYKKIGGHSGDTYGALVVLVETCLLIIMAIMLPAN